MGYTTEFEGVFVLDRELDDKTFFFLYNLANTRRMKRDVLKLPKVGYGEYGFENWGIDGEYYVNGGSGFMGRKSENSIIDYNIPPSTQPGLWCKWIPLLNRKEISWTGEEKFYNYIEWLEYIIKILEMRGYKLNGNVKWYGENHSDRGEINVENNKINIKHGNENV